MTSLRVVLLALAFISVASRLQAQPAVEFSRAAALWEARDFAAAYEALVIYRNQDFGRSFEVDFMLGTSACRIAEKRERGAAFLEVDAARLCGPADVRRHRGETIVHRELQNCMGVGSPSSGTVPRLQQVVTAGGRYQGKTFYWLDQQSQECAGFASHCGRRARAACASRLARQIRLGVQVRAERIASSAVPNGGTQAVFPPLRHCQRSRSHRRATGGCKPDPRAAPRFRSQLRYARAGSLYLRLPDAVDRRTEPAGFTASWAEPELRRDRLFAARRPVDRGGAVIPTTSFGSLFHELFHLMARSNFGNIRIGSMKGYRLTVRGFASQRDGFAGWKLARPGACALRRDIPHWRFLIENHGPADRTGSWRRRVPDNHSMESDFAATG